jgi:hypothetical protein
LKKELRQSEMNDRHDRIAQIEREFAAEGGGVVHDVSAFLQKLVRADFTDE